MEDFGSLQLVEEFGSLQIAEGGDFGSRPAVDRGENFDNQHMPIGETRMKSPYVRRLDLETLSTKRHNEEY